MTLLYDGGHSANEVMAVFHSLMNIDALRERVEAMRNYRINYSDLIDLETRAGIPPTIKNALDLALVDTITNFEYSNYAICTPQGRRRIELRKRLEAAMHAAPVKVGEASRQPTERPRNLESLLKDLVRLEKISPVADLLQSVTAEESQARQFLRTLDGGVIYEAQLAAIEDFAGLSKDSRNSLDRRCLVHLETIEQLEQEAIANKQEVVSQLLEEVQYALQDVEVKIAEREAPEGSQSSGRQQLSQKSARLGEIERSLKWMNRLSLDECRKVGYAQFGELGALRTSFDNECNALQTSQPDTQKLKQRQSPTVAAPGTLSTAMNEIDRLQYSGP